MHSLFSIYTFFSTIYLIKDKVFLSHLNMTQIYVEYKCWLYWIHWSIILLAILHSIKIILQKNFTVHMLALLSEILRWNVNFQIQKLYVKITGKELVRNMLPITLETCMYTGKMILFHGFTVINIDTMWSIEKMLAMNLLLLVI